MYIELHEGFRARHCATTNTWVFVYRYLCCQSKMYVKLYVEEKNPFSDIRTIAAPFIPPFPPKYEI